SSGARRCGSWRSRGPTPPPSSFRGQPLFDRSTPDRALDLLERAHFDLTHALARDAELLREILEGRGLVLQTPLDQDLALARIERRHRPVQQLVPAAELLVLGETRLLARPFIDQPVLPFAFAVDLERRVQRVIVAAHAAVHVDTSPSVTSSR